jgi:NADH-quinone oxidoreductase subunit J
MLLGVDRREVMIEPLPAQRPLALGFGALLAVQMLYIVSKAVERIGDNPAALQALNEDPGNVRSIGRLLFTRYVLQFEVTAVLLTVAVLGGMVLTRRIAEAKGPAEPADIHREERPV